MLLLSAKLGQPAPRSRHFEHLETSKTIPLDVAWETLKHPGLRIVTPGPHCTTDCVLNWPAHCFPIGLSHTPRPIHAPSRRADRANTSSQVPISAFLIRARVQEHAAELCVERRVTVYRRQRRFCLLHLT